MTEQIEDVEESRGILTALLLEGGVPRDLFEVVIGVGEDDGIKRCGIAWYGDQASHLAHSKAVWRALVLNGIRVGLGEEPCYKCWCSKYMFGIDAPCVASNDMPVEDCGR